MFNQCPGLWNSVAVLKDKERKVEMVLLKKTKQKEWLYKIVYSEKSRKPKSTDVNHKWQCAVINADWKPDPLV